MPPPRKRLPRRRRAETRELLLAAGVLLIDEMTHSTRDDLLQRMFAHLSLDDVLDAATRLQLYMAEHPPAMPVEQVPADRADRSDRFSVWLADHRSEILAHPVGDYGPVPKASLYRVFESEADFHRQLAKLLFSGRPNESYAMEDVAETIFAADELPPFAETIRLLSDAEFRQTLGLTAHVDLGATPFLGDPELAAIMREGFERETEALSEFFVLLLGRYGRTMREGLTIVDLHHALDAVFYGFGFRGRIVPEVMGPDSDAGARLFAAVVEAIVLAFTEEV